MAEELIEFIETTQPEGFTPFPCYQAEDDSLTYYFDPGESYAEIIDGRVTLFRSIDDDRLVGWRLTGVQKMMKDLGRFGIAIKHGKRPLDLFLHLLAYVAEKPEARRAYLDLSQKAKGVQLEIAGELAKQS